ncbi:hypothetical protein [Hwanghaeella sp. LZ110]|uniref:hypothetical protein n=1 Tax=Hwanghaeella sp. LZ110 TaxID=3402810 RepID=UPI003B66E85B
MTLDTVEVQNTITGDKPGPNRIFGGFQRGVMIALFAALILFQGHPFQARPAFAQEQVSVITIKDFRRDSVPAVKDGEAKSEKLSKDTFDLPFTFLEQDQKDGLYPVKGKDGSLYYVKPRYAVLERGVCDLAAVDVSGLRNYSTSGAKPPC